MSYELSNTFDQVAPAVIHPKPLQLLLFYKKVEVRWLTHLSCRASYLIPFCNFYHF